MNEGEVFRNVLCVPAFKFNLLSVSKLTKELNCCVSFFPTCCVFQDLSSGKVKGIGDIEDGLYVLRSQGMQQGNVNIIRTMSAVEKTIDPALWHMRLGHIPMGVLRRIKVFNNCSSLSLKQCSICPQARQTRIPFPISNSKADANFDLVHMDVWGPYKLPTHNGKRYFLTLVDDHSRWTWVFLLALKSDVIVVLKQFLSMIKTQFGNIVKVFRSDNGGEFFNTNCSELFTSNGILHQSSCPHTPQQNGVVERKHRHVLETARAIKIQSNLPDKFWGECVEVAVYIINRIPLTTIGNKTPYELLYNKQPSLSHLRVVGCLCFATNFLKKDKFAPRAREAVLLGYAATQKGYKLYDMKSKTIFVSRDVVFHEQLFPFQAHNIDTEEGMHFLDLGGTEMNSECETPTTTITEHSNGEPSHSEVTSSPPSCMLEEEHVEEEHVTDVHDQVVLRKSHRTVRPPIWQADYVLPGKVARNC